MGRRGGRLVLKLKVIKRRNQYKEVERQLNDISIKLGMINGTLQKGLSMIINELSGIRNERANQ